MVRRCNGKQRNFESRQNRSHVFATSGFDYVHGPATIIYYTIITTTTTTWSAACPLLSMLAYLLRPYQWEEEEHDHSSTSSLPVAPRL